MNYSTRLQLDWFSTSRILAHMLLVEKCTANKMADRFGELNENEIQVLYENNVPQTTEKATNFRMKVFNGLYKITKQKHFKYHICKQIACKCLQEITVLYFRLRAYFFFNQCLCTCTVFTRLSAVLE